MKPQILISENTPRAKAIGWLVGLKIMAIAIIIVLFGSTSRAQAPSISSLSPTSGPEGTSVTISGNNFGSTQGSSLVTFSDESVAATPTSWSNTQIVVPVPTFASTGNVNVTVNGTASNGINFTVSSGITASPSSGAVGTSVTISGSNFGSTQGNSTVTFGLVTATPSSWHNTQIVAPVPNGVVTGSQVLAVTVSGNTASTSFNIPPAITSLSPSSSAVGSSVTINGTSFGSSNGTNSFVTFNNQDLAATPTSWSDSQIVVTVPSGAATGNVNVTVNGTVSNGVNVTVTQTQTPSITSLLPASGAVGSSVEISGSDFGSTQGSVSFNGKAAAVSSWSNTSVTAAVPTGASTGNVVVTAGGVASNGVTFNVIPPPNIGSLSQSAGLVGSQLTINGTNFNTPPAVGTVSFNGTTGTVVTWTNTYVVATVPPGATTGNVVVRAAGGVQSNGVSFTVQTPYSFTVTYAPNGDIVSSNDSVNGNYTYTYDDFNRLSTAVATNGTGCAESYDQYGNRWSQQPHGTGNSCFSSSFSFTGNNTVNNNRIDTYSYDAAGNLLNDGHHSYTYDAENRLIQVDGGNTATYTYGALGQRVEGPNGDYLYDLGGKMITQIGLNNVWNYGEIYAAGRHIATYSGATTNFFGSDWLGTKRAMTGLDQALSQTCTSLPFGDGVNCTGGNISFNLFTDDVHDPETNLEHTLFRKYSSALGRWLTPDPAGMGSADPGNPQSWNRYAYVTNSPTTARDPNGLCDDFFCGGFGDPFGGFPVLTPPFGGVLTWLPPLSILPGEVGGIPAGLSLPSPIQVFLADLPWNNPCANSPWIFDKCGLTGLASIPSMGSDATGIGMGAGSLLSRLVALLQSLLSCDITVKCRGTDWPGIPGLPSLGDAGIDHCDAQVVSRSGTVCSLSAGPVTTSDGIFFEQLQAWATCPPQGPFTGNTIYKGSGCGTVKCLVDSTWNYHNNAVKDLYLPSTSNDWLKNTFAGCGISLPIGSLGDKW